jgi:predicted nucleic acid-binding protein
MSGRVFLDTNVLVYADDADAGKKRTRAQAVLTDAFSAATGVVSTQVLQEYFAVATRKLGVAAEVAQHRVELYAQLAVVIVSVEHIVAAIKLHRLSSIAFWDALVVRAAASAGCARVLSEDMQDGASLDGVRIENPFR